MRENNSNPEKNIIDQNFSFTYSKFHFLASNFSSFLHIYYNLKNKYERKHNIYKNYFFFLDKSKKSTIFTYTINNNPIYS